ncbi:MAG TPA: hypothetical protein VFS08_15185 [Gemmatimonadaceae bacterium]|nr:hypothetical protein [Gemmatimonadaceae bacterium]
MRPVRLVIVALLLAAACARNSAAPEEGRAARATANGVTAERVRGGVRLTNGTTTDIGYVVVDRGWLAVLALCDDGPARCPHVAPGTAIIVPDTQIGGLSADTRELVVYWWRWVDGGTGGPRADAPQQLLLAP